MGKDVTQYWRYKTWKKQEVFEFIESEKNRLPELVGKTREELLKLHPWLQVHAYELGLLKSKEYTSTEINAKKEYYLSLPYDYEKHGKGKKFWVAMVDKYFSSQSFNDYPDCHFLLLDIIFNNGTL